MTLVASAFDGRMVDTASREWMHECECRRLLTMFDAAARESYLVKIRKKRGEAAAWRLQTDAAVLFLLRNPQPAWEWYHANFVKTVGLMFADHVLQRAHKCLAARAAATETSGRLFVEEAGGVEGRHD